MDDGAGTSSIMDEETGSGILCDSAEDVVCCVCVASASEFLAEVESKSVCKGILRHAAETCGCVVYVGSELEKGTNVSVEGVNSAYVLSIRGELVSGMMAIFIIVCVGIIDNIAFDCVATGTDVCVRLGEE